jgi:arylsulfatase A-like enzyme
MAPFRTGAFWPVLATSLVGYGLSGAALDGLLSALGPAPLRRSPWARGLAILTIVASLVLLAGEARSLPLLCVAAAFAALALGRFAWPIAVIVAAIAFAPSVRSPASEGVQPDVASDAEAAAASGSPSFAVVVLDTLRWDHTSAYGYERDTTPNLRGLAARGVRFERAYSTGHWSLPSHASLFTGLYPAHHGAHGEHMRLDPDHPTLAETLARNGYETANFTANPWISPGTGMSRGFQHNHESWRSFHLDPFLLANRVHAGLFFPDRDKGAESTLNGVRRWLSERNRARPYFLFVNIFEAHAPYQQVPREFRTRFTDPALSLRSLEGVGNRMTKATQTGSPVDPEEVDAAHDLLDGAIAAADAALGELLRELGDEPIVVVVSDHGELFGEHTLYGHSNTLYEPLIHIPMVIAGGSLPRGISVAETVSLVDVMPTLLALAGIAAPEVDGIDLHRILAGERPGTRRSVRAEQFHNQIDRGWKHHRPPEVVEVLQARRQAVVSGRLKRVVSATGGDVGYDLNVDPQETQAFSGAETGLEARVPPAWDGPATEMLDPIQARALQALGYLQ